MRGGIPGGIEELRTVFVVCLDPEIAHVARRLDRRSGDGRAVSAATVLGRT
jgi:hypothetical protein